jgi:hypothetical protein
MAKNKIIERNTSNNTLIARAKRLKDYIIQPSNVSFEQWKDKEERKLKAWIERQVIEEKEIINTLHKRDPSLICEYLKYFNSPATQNYRSFYGKFREYYKDPIFLSFSEERKGLFISRVFNKTLRDYNKEIKNYIYESFNISIINEDAYETNKDNQNNTLNSIERLKINSSNDDNHLQNLLLNYFKKTLKQIDSYFHFKLHTISKNGIKDNGNNENLIKQNILNLYEEIQKVFRKVLASFHPDTYSVSKGFNKETALIVEEKYKELEKNRNDKLVKLDDYIKHPALLIIDQQNKDNLPGLNNNDFCFQQKIDEIFGTFAAELKKININLNQNLDDLQNLKKETLKDISDNAKLDGRINRLEDLLERAEKKVQNKRIFSKALSSDISL